MPAPYSAQEQILQALRAWLAYCTGIALTSIVPAGDKGPRPALPYLTVRVLVPDVPVGTGEVLYTTTTTTLPAKWVTLTTYALDAYVRPTASGATPTLIYKATRAGVSAAGEPTWPTVEGGTVVDGTVTWTAEARVRQWEAVQGHRRATVQIDAWGHGAADFLAAAVLQIDLPAAQEILVPYLVHVARALSSARDLTALRDTAFEVHAQQDLEVVYALALHTSVRTGIAASVEWDVTLDTANPPADLHVTGTQTT